MKFRNVVVFAATFLAGGPVLAGPGTQATRPAQTRSAAADAPTRIAVINIQNAIISTEEGKQKSQELTTQFTPRRDELQGIAKKMQDLQQRVQDGQRTLSDQEKGRLAVQYQQLQRQYQRKQQELNDDVNDAQTDAVDAIGSKMVPLIDRYAQQHGFSVVLDTSQQTNPVIYASSTVDITQDIVKLYDQTYPSKNAAAATSKPKTP